MKHIYNAYVDKLLAANPQWWVKANKSLKMTKGYVYGLEKGKPVLKMSWQLWKEIVTSYYHKAKDAIIQGETLKLGSGLGNILAIRVERTFSNKVVDWGATYKLNLRDEKGMLKRVFYTDDDYCRIKWQKFGMVPNEKNYKFNPASKHTDTGKGFKQEFVQALLANPMLKYKYKFTNAKPPICNTHTAASETS